MRAVAKTQAMFGHGNPRMWSWLRQWWSLDGRLGARGEAAAERYLRGLGYVILARQLRNVGGELDLIARDGETIVFIEVKSRQSSGHGRPEEFVDREKQRRIARAALAFLKRRRWLDRRTRFDIIAVTWPVAAGEPQIVHLRHAFDAPADCW